MLFTHVSSATLYITLNLSPSTFFSLPCLFSTSRDPLSLSSFSVLFPFSFAAAALCFIIFSGEDQRRSGDGDGELGAVVTGRERRGGAASGWVDRLSRGKRKNRGERNRGELGQIRRFRSSEHGSEEVKLDSHFPCSDLPFLVVDLRDLWDLV
ncbi:hypothetical protein Dimus_039672 [Dionaea muscipula]